MMLTRVRALLLLVLIFAGASDNASAREVQLKVSTYNLFFLPYQWLGEFFDATGIANLEPSLAALYSNAYERSKLVPGEISSLADVFVFQEAFDKDSRKELKQGMRFLGVQYATDTLERSFIASGGRFAGSGLVIMSRYPIVEQDGIYYQDDFRDRFGIKHKGIKPFSSDKLADKGVLYAKIVKDGVPFHVFTTHTQAKSNDDHHKPVGIEIRKQQFMRLEQFIESKNIPTNEPVIIAGDMNVGRDARPLELSDMLETLRGASVPISGYDYTTIHTPLYEDHDETHAVGDQIDYIMGFAGGVLPTAAWSAVLEQVHLSDHFPLLAQLTYDLR